MPGLDTTGPKGQGSRTGRQMGNCVSKQKESTEQELTPDTIESTGRSRGSGRGRRKGLGRGRGFGLGRGIGHGRNKNT
jgi:hypothetical protein